MKWFRLKFLPEPGTSFSPKSGNPELLECRCDREAGLRNALGIKDYERVKNAVFQVSFKLNKGIKQLPRDIEG